MAAIIYTGKEAPIDVRNEAWYMRYFNVNESALNNLRRKNPNAVIRMLGIQGDLQHGLRTRYEFTCLQEDINQSIADGKIHVRPTWIQVEFKDLQEELKWAQKSGWWGGMRRAPSAKRAIIICSCPSQIGTDKTIMRQVEKICEGRSNVELTFSEAGNASSELFENMSISGGGGGGRVEAATSGTTSRAGGGGGGGGRGGAAEAAAEAAKWSHLSKSEKGKKVYEFSQNDKVDELRSLLKAGAPPDDYKVSQSVIGRGREGQKEGRRRSSNNNSHDGLIDCQEFFPVRNKEMKKPKWKDLIW